MGENADGLAILNPAVIQGEPVAEGTRAETVVSLGTSHPLAGLLEYLSSASLEGLSSFDLKQAAEIGSIKRELSALLERMADAQAIQKFIRWREEERRKPAVQSIIARRSLPPPGDISPLDPFFRRSPESQAIRRTQFPWQRARWPLYFERFGCLLCHATDRTYGSCGCCSACVDLLRERLKHIDAGVLRCPKSMPQRGRWDRYFARHGCTGCGNRKKHAACGFCAPCYEEICNRLAEIENELRAEAQREPE